MLPFEIGVQWLHVIVSIFWFGSVLFADLVLMPGVMKMSAAGQQEFGVQVGARVAQFMVPAGILSIALGFVRGTVLGDVHSINDLFGTPYGITWLIALLAALATFAWGLFVITPAVDKLKETTLPEEATALIARVRTYTMLELIGFLVIFSAMIAMHFE